ncbi:hypothetical protein ACFPAF_11525 [Hymenobacter endophyticus]|uniref:Quercetin 2,3-dioxygenase C-terminal cupin domain-containing protein n=1 Tax=Hymenobacter endophyticus TaxID=3076335 RepID=A0ABU3TI31_9BACT|nr:hypothetical protein [Hymenobacter endophyticus]MDU0371027.1 hypothetical protein [Hymenobacter endophyticus]
MSPPLPARIFLADQHGLLTTPQSGRCSVFSFGPYQDAQRQPLGRLLAINEETLHGGQELVLPASQAAYCLVLPLTGEISCGVAAELALVQVEQAWGATVAAGAALTLRNPYAAEAVRFLHIWVAAPETPPAPPETISYTFAQLENNLAELVSTSGNRPFSLSLGRFNGREEAVYHLRHPDALFFAYVLAGAFEVEGRLLHARDGLALWQLRQAELEALSNNALVVVLEVVP